MRLPPRHRLAFALVLPLVACGGPARIDLDPASLRFNGAGQVAPVHATPRARNNKALPDQVCRWTSSDEKVAAVAAKGNDAVVTATGPGAATVTCTVGSLKAELGVAVRVVARLTVSPDAVALELTDERVPTPLRVEAFDDQGAPVAGRIVTTSCDDEEVCRGDARGQLWPVGAGASVATVQVDGAKARLPVTVKDKRVATKPKIVKRDYMEDLEKEVQARQAKEAAAAAKAAARP